jgi:hypothetical protein
MDILKLFRQLVENYDQIGYPGKKQKSPRKGRIIRMILRKAVESESRKQLFASGNFYFSCHALKQAWVAP